MFLLLLKYFADRGTLRRSPDRTHHITFFSKTQHIAVFSVKSKQIAPSVVSGSSSACQNGFFRRLYARQIFSDV